MRSRFATRAVLSMAVLSLTTACTDFPDLGDTIPRDLEQADFPKLVPVEPLLARANEVQITPESTAALDARVARLRARAARLRGQVVDSGTRARMRDGVAPING